MDPHIILLIVTIITGADKPNIQHKEPMADVDSCIAEVSRILHHRFADSVGAKGVSANCVVPQPEESPS